MLSKESFITRSMLFRMQVYVAFIFPAFINYQTTDVSVLLLISVALLAWGYCEGENTHLEWEAKQASTTAIEKLAGV